MSQGSSSELEELSSSYERLKAEFVGGGGMLPLINLKLSYCGEGLEVLSWDVLGRMLALGG